MKKKIIWIEIVSIIFTLFILLTISTVYVNHQNYKTTQIELQNYSNMTCEVFDGTNFEEIRNMISVANREIRITVIDMTGEVVIDSSLVEMGNHLNREELQKLGECVTRYSDSLETNMMYLARLDDGYYIRLAIPVASLRAFIYNYIGFGFIAVCIILSVSIIGILFLCNKTFAPIKREINKLEKILDNDLSDDTDFEHLSSKINELATLLTEKVISLSNEKEKTQYILDNINQGLILLNEDGKIEFINAYSLSLFGFKKAYILDKDYMYIFRNIPVQEKIENCMHNIVAEQVNFDWDGRKYLLYIDTFKNTSSNVSPSKVILFIVDITLQESMHSLKREFFANASHELKSPLTSIIGYQQLIQQGILTTEEEIQDATLRTMKAAQRMNQLIVEMLDLSRLENQVQSIQEKVSVSRAIQDCLIELQPSIEQKKIQVILDMDDSTLLSNQTDIYKLVKNIIDNAIVYNHENGKIVIELKENKLCIADTGIGIAQEDLKFIFDRFYRVDKAKSRESAGTGLGLSIVKHICLLYGYQITVMSKIGKGTKVTIEF